MISYSQKQNERISFTSIVSELHTVGLTGVSTYTTSQIRLIEVPQAPSPTSTVSIPGYTEVMSFSGLNQYIVNYTTGVITFSSDVANGTSVSVSYRGLGSEFAAEDVNEIQSPLNSIATLNISFSWPSAPTVSWSVADHVILPNNISNSATDDFTFPRDVIVTRNLKTLDVTSASVSPASTGVLRLAHSDVIAWRNFANSGDDVLASDGSDDLTWKGNVIATGSGAVTSITGTTNQIIASSSVGAITLSTPQDINTTSSPTFANLTLSSTALVGGVSIAPSAIVDIQSTTKGFLPPRMTTTQRTSISSPAEGLIVYDVTDHQWYGQNNSTWVILG